MNREGKIDNNTYRVGYREDRYEDGIRNDILRTIRDIGRIHCVSEHGDFREGISNSNFHNKRRRNIHDTDRMVLGQRQGTRTHRQEHGYKFRNKPEIIAMHCENDNITHAQAVKKANEGIDLKKIGFGNVNMRKARNGGLIIRVNGPDNKTKADALAMAMKDVLAKDCVRISRPVKRTDIRVTGIDEDDSPDDIRAAIINIDGGKGENIKISSIKTTNDGRNVAWISCPANTAEKVNRYGLDIGWGKIRANKMLPKPVQCYRCFEFGHVRNTCKSHTDRSSL